MVLRLATAIPFALTTAGRLSSRLCTKESERIGLIGIFAADLWPSLSSVKRGCLSSLSLSKSEPKRTGKSECSVLFYSTYQCCMSGVDTTQDVEPWAMKTQQVASKTPSPLIKRALLG